MQMQEQTEKSKFLERVIYLVFLVLLVAGFASPYSYNLLPANTILEIMLPVIVFIVIFARSGIRKNYFVIFSLSFLYILFSFLYAVGSVGANYLDFLQAYKTFYYLMLLCLLPSLGLLSKHWHEKLFLIMLFFFSLKYGYSVLLHFDARLAARPAILYENNFELIFLAIMYIVNVHYNSKRRDLYFYWLLSLVVISGSRSAMLAMIFCFYANYIKGIDYKTILGFLFAPIVLYLVLDSFISRLQPGQTIEDIDRFRFLTYFIYEIRDWTILNYLFGAERITPLSNETCSALSFYQNLFSYSKDGTCYSVILHSYVMRALFDHGLIMFTLVFLVYFSLLKKENYSFKNRFCVLGVAVSSSLSVSAFNSIYVALPFALILISEKIRNDPTKR